MKLTRHCKKSEEIITTKPPRSPKGEYIESSQNGIWSWFEVLKLSIQVHITYTDTFYIILSSTSLGPWMNLVPWSEVSLVQAEVSCCWNKLTGNFAPFFSTSIGSWCDKIMINHLVCAFALSVPESSSGRSSNMKAKTIGKCTFGMFKTWRNREVTLKHDINPSKSNSSSVLLEYSTNQNLQDSPRTCVDECARLHFEKLSGHLVGTVGSRPPWLDLLEIYFDLRIVETTLIHMAFMLISLDKFGAISRNKQPCYWYHWRPMGWYDHSECCATLKM